MQLRVWLLQGLEVLMEYFLEFTMQVLINITAVGQT